MEIYFEYEFVYKRKMNGEIRGNILLKFGSQTQKIFFYFLRVTFPN
jgi:hypothetical protein